MTPIPCALYPEQDRLEEAEVLLSRLPSPPPTDTVPAMPLAYLKAYLSLATGAGVGAGATAVATASLEASAATAARYSQSCPDTAWRERFQALHKALLVALGRDADEMEVDEEGAALLQRPPPPALSVRTEGE